MSIARGRRSSQQSLQRFCHFRAFPFTEATKRAAYKTVIETSNGQGACAAEVITTSNRSKLAIRLFVFGGAPFVERAFNRLQIFQVGGLNAPNANVSPRIDLPRDEIAWIGLEGGANRLGHRRLSLGGDLRNGC